MSETNTCTNTCEKCGKKAKGKRLPPGWKRTGKTFATCRDCWRQAYLLRAVTFPVASPVGATWDELRAALDASWANSTGLANWAVTELAKRDVVRGPGDGKLPAMRPVYLYPEARRRFPAMDCQSVVAVLHAVEGKYRKARLDVVWRSAAVLPRHRYPVPYPVHNQGWSARYATPEDPGVPDRSPLVRVRLQGKPFLLRLRGGHHYRRQLAAFAQIAGGQAVRGELALYRQRCSDGAHRNGTEGRTPGGGRHVSYRVMAKLVAWLPRDGRGPLKPLAGQGELRTGGGAFLTAVVDGREPWVLHADHVRRRVAAHRKFLDAISDDTKYEKRWPKRQRLQMNECRELRCEKQHSRLKSWNQQAARMAAEFLWRQGVAEVLYQDRDKSFAAEYPWHQLKGELARVCDEVGLLFTVVASGEAVSNTAAGETTQANGGNDIVADTPETTARKDETDE